MKVIRHHPRMENFGEYSEKHSEEDERHLAIPDSEHTGEKIDKLHEKLKSKKNDSWIVS